MEFFKLICFVGGQRGPKDYMTEVSSSLGNLHIMDNLILLLTTKHPHVLKFPIFKSAQNNQGGGLMSKCC